MNLSRRWRIAIFIQYIVAFTFTVMALHQKDWWGLFIAASCVVWVLIARLWFEEARKLLKQKTRGQGVRADQPEEDVYGGGTPPPFPSSVS